MIDQFLKLFKALNSDANPWQMAFAAAFGLVIGFTPLWSPHNLLVLLLAFIFRVHLASFFVFWLLFSALAYLLDPWFDQIGYSLLTQVQLTDFWTTLYQNDFWRVLRFNHTITLGSFVVSVIAFLPLAVILRLSIIRYRGAVMPWVEKLKVVQLLKGSKLYELYQRLDG
ncbi:TIGR03546 family protein [Reinekea thalattae]|uniref:TIGR03546 family protein n=1 Tax=Reinekea thalattae TaxID=2593301 RepID=A0A5C8Z513_9GAMM|nr:TIGR03546 family protein [Reinekea thalattae]TXR53112.1 TIGR03546 family protein [Reinekea thalattae]